MRVCFESCLGRCLAWVLVLASVPSALGQSMSMSMGLTNPNTIFRTQITGADIDRIVDVLMLREDQATLAKDLYESYARSLELRSSELVEQQLQLVDKGMLFQSTDVTRGTKQSEQEKAWKDEARGLEAAFLSDLRALVGTDDAAGWERALREHRRVKERAKGTLLGEAVDVVRVARTTVPEACEVQEVKEAIERYAIDLDRLYQARDQAARAFRGVGAVEAATQEQRQHAWKDLWDVRQRIVARNEASAREVMAQLTPERASEFERAFFEEAYGRLLQRTQSGQIVHRAMDHPSLTREGRDAVAALVAEYEANVLALVREGLSLEKEREASFQPTFEAGTTHGTDQLARFRIEEDSPLGRLRARRAALDAGIRQRVLAMLTKDQRADVLKDCTMHVVVSNSDAPSQWFPVDDED